MDGGSSHCTEAATKTIPKKRKCKKASSREEALQIAEKRRETKCKGDRESYRLPKNGKERQEDLLK